MSRRVDPQHQDEHPAPRTTFDVGRMAVGMLAVAVIAAGAAFDRRLRGRARSARLARPEINRWEDEGGAIPLDGEASMVNSTGRQGTPYARG